MKKLLLLLIIPFLSFGQTPITQQNFQQAVDDWLEAPVSAEVTYGHISDWDVSNVNDMYGAFYGAINFNQDISDWDVSNVTNMGRMFCEASVFNQDIDSWDVSNVTTMRYMFSDANSFNQNIGNWDVSNVTSMRYMFSDANSFNQNIGNWDVSSVSDMSSMFSDANYFNQDIGDWDVSSVSNMRSMFWDANSFNQDIGDWDVSNVTDMSWMLDGINLSIENYDALLCGWSQLELQENVNFNGGNSNYCTGDEARQYIIDIFNWVIIDEGLYDEGCNQTESCNNNTFIQEIDNNQSLLKTIDILGREITNKGFQLHIYDDGTVEKKYIVK